MDEQSKVTVRGPHGTKKYMGGGNQAKNENFGIDLSVSTWCFLDQFQTKNPR